MLKFVGDRHKYKFTKDYFNLDKSPFTVGRGKHADLVIVCLQVSRAHFVLTKTDSEMWLIECLSMGELKIDGQRIQKCEKRVLTDGCIIQLVDDLDLIFSFQCRQTHRPGTAKDVDSHRKSIIDLTGTEEIHPQLQAEETTEVKLEAAAATTALGEVKKDLEELTNLKQHLQEQDLQIISEKHKIAKLEEEFRIRESLQVDEIVNARAETAVATTALAKVKNELDQALHNQCEANIYRFAADLRNTNLEEEMRVKESLHAEEILKVQAETFKAETKANIHSQEVARAKEETAEVRTAFNEAEKKVQELRYDVETSQALAAIRAAEIALLKERFEEEQETTAEIKTEMTINKADLRLVEEENRNLRLEIATVQAMSSTLSDEVANFQRYWEDSEKNNVAAAQNNAELAAELAGLRDKLENEKNTKKVLVVKELTSGLRKVPDLTKEVNAAKELACANQMKEFEEFLETDLQCAICFELVISSTALNCGHTFCNKCVRDWQAKSADCPTCRVPITSMQRCKMLDSFIARAAVKLSNDFKERRREATCVRGTDSQGQAQKKRARKDIPRTFRGRQPNFDLPGPEPVPEAQFFVDLT